MDLQVAMQRWQQLDAEHHLHPFTTHHELAEKGTRVIDRGEGCYIWEADGHKLIDGMAGLWCVQVGYGRERLARTAYEQLKKLS
jgi:putrescine aminotransferase